MTTFSAKSLASRGGLTAETLKALATGRTTANLTKAQATQMMTAPPGTVVVAPAPQPTILGIPRKYVIIGGLGLAATGLIVFMLRRKK